MYVSSLTYNVCRKVLQEYLFHLIYLSCKCCYCVLCYYMYRLTSINLMYYSLHGFKDYLLTLEMTTAENLIHALL